MAAGQITPVVPARPIARTYGEGARAHAYTHTPVCPIAFVVVSIAQLKPSQRRRVDILYYTWIKKNYGTNTTITHKKIITNASTRQRTPPFGQIVIFKNKGATETPCKNQRRKYSAQTPCENTEKVCRNENHRSGRKYL